MPARFGHGVRPADVRAKQARRPRASQRVPIWRARTRGPALPWAVDRSRTRKNGVELLDRCNASLSAVAALSRLSIGVTTSGVAVVEAELENGDYPSHLLQRASEAGAGLLWLHATADLRPLGFTRANGYRRLRCDVAPEAVELEPLGRARYGALMNAAYHGLWGHRQLPPDDEPPNDANVVCLSAGGEPIGVCTFWPTLRLIDAPGVIPDARSPENYVLLLLGACWELGREGSVGLDSWGDDEAVIRAYEQLGFTVVEDVPGWEMRL
jgi:hypothetical protein